MRSAWRPVLLLSVLLFAALSPQAVASAQVAAPPQGAANAPAQPAPDAIQALQAQNASQAAQLRELTRERDEARALLLTEQAGTPGWLIRLPPRVRAALPAAALGVSVLALLLAAGMAWRTWNGRVALSAEYRTARARLRETEAELARGQTSPGSSRPADRPKPDRPEPDRREPDQRRPEVHNPNTRQPRAAAETPVSPAESFAEGEVTNRGQGAVAASLQARLPGKDPVGQSASAAELPSGEAKPPVEQAEPLAEEVDRDRLSMTGDPAADYERARQDPEHGTARLRERYGSLWGLSCTNLEEARRAGGLLRFAESSRPTFLLLRSPAGLLAVPVPDRDPLAMRQSLEGVFVFPDLQDGPIALSRPATVGQAGAEWVLLEPGEFRFA